MSASTAQLTLPTPLAREHADWPFVTVISRGRHVHQVEATNLHAGSRTFRWYLSWGYSETSDVDAENIDWTRGWHERDSPEVKAMFVARALT